MVDQIRVLVVGWSGSGKTSLIQTLTGNLTGNRVDDVLSIFHQTKVSVAYKGERVEFIFTDTQSEPEYNHHRQSLYKSADIIFITHSTRCQAKWVSETREFAPKTPAMFVGTHRGLLDNPAKLRKSASRTRLRSRSKSSLLEPPLFFCSTQGPDYPYLILHEAINQVTCTARPRSSSFCLLKLPSFKWKHPLNISFLSKP